MVDTIENIIPQYDTAAAGTAGGDLLQMPGESLLDAGQHAGNAGFVISQSTGEWYFYFLMAMITGYIIARVYLGRLLSSTFMAAVRYNQAASMFKDNSQLQRQRDNALYSFYFISLGFYLMLISERLTLHPYGFEGLFLLLFYTALAVIFFIFRILTTNIVGVIFYSGSLFREYLYLGFTYNKLMGIILIPFNFLLVFTEGGLQQVIFYLSAGMLILLFIMKYIRGLIFSMKHRVLNLYLFLYLCALEIVPILLLYKWFTIIA